ncbi:MAG: bifunctional 4-hydroxy-2-oxoglutarate aldolase/2-dehydro-3-deoxy-phosphogluconate aldolase [Betaproteobacteria bacterium]|nr:bifunctional 4-hydroxy-2-oxoglutarate aldolase/2-dehydro-3-deoxy-phosphogluconate aldolase [Betaproteobacteria bacterium]
MTTLSKTNFQTVLRAARVMPILTVRDVSQAVRTAQALAAGGMTVMEITLRTAVAVTAIRAIRDEVPGVLIGAGTLLKRGDFARAEDAGAQFAVSPGLTDELAQDAIQSPLPFLPGVQTAAEVMRAAGYGFRELKFYPARAAGGVDVLVDFSSIFPQVGWCPTGKIGRDDVAGYLALPSVLCCGGSWVAPQDMQARGDWEGITRLAASVKPMLAESGVQVGVHD